MKQRSLKSNEIHFFRCLVSREGHLDTFLSPIGGFLYESAGPIQEKRTNAQVMPGGLVCL